MKLVLGEPSTLKERIRNKYPAQSVKVGIPKLLLMRVPRLNPKTVLYRQHNNFVKLIMVITADCIGEYGKINRDKIQGFMFPFVNFNVNLGNLGIMLEPNDIIIRAIEGHYTASIIPNDMHGLYCTDDFIIIKNVKEKIAHERFDAITKYLIEEKNPSIRHILVDCCGLKERVTPKQYNKKKPDLIGSGNSAEN